MIMRSIAPLQLGLSVNDISAVMSIRATRFDSRFEYMPEFCRAIVHILSLIHI